MEDVLKNLKMGDDLHNFKRLPGIKNDQLIKQESVALLNPMFLSLILMETWIAINISTNS